ncbi:MAG: hypothetical protein AAB360_00765 [Patescibacteria group bacterium]
MTELEKIHSVEDYFTTIVPPERGGVLQEKWQELRATGKIDVESLGKIPDSEGRFRVVEALASLIEKGKINAEDISDLIESFGYEERSSINYNGAHGVAGFYSGHVRVHNKLFERYAEGEFAGQYRHELDHNIAHEIAHAIIEYADKSENIQLAATEGLETEVETPLELIAEALGGIDIDAESITVQETKGAPAVNRKERLAEALAVYIASGGEENEFLRRRISLIQKDHLETFFVAPASKELSLTNTIAQATERGRVLIASTKALFQAIDDNWERLKAGAKSAAQGDTEIDGIFDLWGPESQLSDLTQAATFSPAASAPSQQPTAPAENKAAGQSGRKTNSISHLPGEKAGHSNEVLSALGGLLKSFEEINPIKITPASV